MQTARFAMTAIALVTASQAFAASHIVEIAWSRDGAFAHGAIVEPGKFVELCGKLALGDVIRWEFAASVPVDFNIHYHVGKEAEFPAKAAGLTSADGVLAPASKQDYCWMWSNKSAQGLELTVQMSK